MNDLHSVATGRCEQPLTPPEGVTLSDREETAARERAVVQMLSGPRAFERIVEAISEMPPMQANALVACFRSGFDFGRFDDSEIAYLARKQVEQYLLGCVDMDRATADLLEAA